MDRRPGRIYFDEAFTGLRERLREEMNAAATSVRLSRLACEVVTDRDVAARIEQLGFGGEAARLFDLVPLVEVAWADGRIQRAERATILEVVRARGFDLRSEPAQRIAALLESPPDAAFFDEARAVCAELLLARGEASRLTTLALCRKVAEAAGGIFGFRSATSAAEAGALARIARDLGIDDAT